MKQNLLVIGGIGLLFFFFLLFFILMIVLYWSIDGSSSSSLKNCELTGNNPVPLPNEVIGATSPLTLYSTKSPESYEPPCFVYFGNNVTFNVSDYGIKLPVGVYNVYVQYYSLDAINGDTVADRMIQTEFTGFNSEITAQRLVGNRTAVFENSRALTEYDTVSLTANNNTLRVESAIKGFTAQTLRVDRIEVLFEKVL